MVMVFDHQIHHTIVRFSFWFWIVAAINFSSEPVEYLCNLLTNHVHLASYADLIPKVGCVCLSLRECFLLASSKHGFIELYVVCVFPLFSNYGGFLFSKQIIWKSSVFRSLNQGLKQIITNLLWKLKPPWFQHEEKDLEIRGSRKMSAVKFIFNTYILIQYIWYQNICLKSWNASSKNQTI